MGELLAIGKITPTISWDVDFIFFACSQCRKVYFQHEQRNINIA